jgi:hypothetical protein
MHAIEYRQSGFTIFEALIYIALFTFIIGGSIASAYQIFEGTAQVKQIAERETELNFVLRKLDWALNGADNVSVLNGGGTLQVLRDSGKTYEFSVTDGMVMLKLVGTDEYQLTNSGVDVSDIVFALSGSNPEILEITMVVDGESTGTTTRFIR